MAWIEKCRECKEPFAITGGASGPLPDYEEINCPHCKATWGRAKTASVFITKALTPAEEREYSSRRGPN